jgi:SNF2 family DNA or RNA helicase
MSQRTIALLTAAQLATDHPGFVPASGIAPEDFEASAKLVESVSRIDQALARGERVLIFSRFTRTLDLLEPRLLAAGRRVMRIDGNTKDRTGAVAGFQAGEYDVALLSTRAANAGITLTRATYVQHLSHWWNGAVRDQCTARSYRFSQTAPVHVDYLVLDGSVDERILAVQQRKLALSDAVLGEGALESARLAPTDVADLFGISRTEIVEPPTIPASANPDGGD